MFRWSVIVLLSALGLTGCAQPNRAMFGREIPHAALLFDPVPKAPSASRIVHRSNWPSVYRSTAMEEIVIYREQINDIQHGGRGSTDRYQRRFHSVRVGRTRR